METTYIVLSFIRYYRNAESEYSAFMKYKEMKDKYDYMQGFNVNSKEDIAKTAVFSAFTEGLQLFASLQFYLIFQDIIK